MVRQIVKVGKNITQSSSQLTIRIPKAIQEVISIQKGDHVMITAESLTKITIEKENE